MVKSYSHILKSTSIFGGVQFFNIIISIARSKLIAILLGPMGVGIAGLLQASSSFIGVLTSFGLGSSSIKSISEANGKNDMFRVSLVVSVLRRWVWITGLLATIITVFLSPWLSLFSFGSKENWHYFALIALSLLFSQLSAGQLAILQGLRALKDLAKANITGALLSLLFSIPLYYYWGVKRIAPAILVSSAVTLFRSWYFSKRIILLPVSLDLKTVFSEGKELLSLGFILSISSLITVTVGYLIRIFISNQGSVEDVGLYNAGFAIINTYVGMIFTAMSTDYYPRLSSVAFDNKKAFKAINEQAEVAIILMAPLLSVFIIFSSLIIVGLYSNRFIPANNMIVWAAIGVFLKAATWAVGFLFVAKGSKKIFFISEFFSSIFLLVTSLMGYSLGGLNGIGIAFLINYIIAIIQINLIAYIMWGFFYCKSFISLFFILFSFVILSFLVSYFFSGFIKYFFGVIIIFLCGGYSFYQLNKRVNLTGFFINKLKK